MGNQGSSSKWQRPGRALLGSFSKRTPSRGHVFQDIEGGILLQAPVLPWAVEEEALSLAIPFFQG